MNSNESELLARLGLSEDAGERAAKSLESTEDKALKYILSDLARLQMRVASAYEATSTFDDIDRRDLADMGALLALVLR